MSEPSATRNARNFLAYSLFANSVYPVTAKSLDAYALAKLLLEKEARPYAVVAREIGMSASEFHAAVQRLGVAGLVDPATRQARGRATLDYFLSGLTYVFPAQPGPLQIGLPTSFAAPPLASHIVSGGQPLPVWPDARGTVRGYSIEPLHPSAAKAAREDSRFHEILALLDALREGRAREKRLAEQELRHRILTK